MTSLFTPIIGPEIFDLRPDYVAISVVAEGVDNAANHAGVDRFIQEVMAQSSPPPWADGHLDAWQAAYRAFGAKPQRTPCSAEALLTRIRKDGRLPAINAVVDLYNAVSVRYALPVGGENIAAYVGNPRLVRASGNERFDTTKEGHGIMEAVPSGEVVWADERGVTCRRWNWRQGTRTRIDLLTRRMWFVLERLEPMPLAAVQEAASALMRRLGQMSSSAHLTACLIDRRGTVEMPMIDN